MKKLILLLVMLASGAKADPCTLSSLGWMAGTWRNAGNPDGSEERWVMAPQNVLMGSSWEFPPGQAGYAENMTIRQDGAATRMLLRHFDAGLSKAWEAQDAPMVFTLASCARMSAVFDGEGSHAGEHLTYRRDGDHMQIIGDFLHQGKADREEWQMVRRE